MGWGEGGRGLGFSRKILYPHDIMMRIPIFFSIWSPWISRQFYHNPPKFLEIFHFSTGRGYGFFSGKVNLGNITDGIGCGKIVGNYLQNQRCSNTEKYVKIINWIFCLLNLCWLSLGYIIDSFETTCAEKRLIDVLLFGTAKSRCAKFQKHYVAGWRNIRTGQSDHLSVGCGQIIRRLFKENFIDYSLENK